MNRRRKVVRAFVGPVLDDPGTSLISSRSRVPRYACAFASRACHDDEALKASLCGLCPSSLDQNKKSMEILALFRAREGVNGIEGG